MIEPCKISSGCKAIDTLLEGGYESDVVTTIYGPAGSGKTCISILATIDVAKNGKKVIYIDTEGSFSIDRLKQLAPDYKEVLQSILFLRPVSFAGQKKAFEKLKDLTSDKIGLIIVDTIAMLYRLELGKNEAVYEVNRELGQQISFLTEIARKQNIPILMTNQVYSGFDSADSIRMVGGDIVKYGSKCIIELQKVADKKYVVLKKHRSIQEEKKFMFQIVREGIIELKTEIKEEKSNPLLRQIHPR